MSLKIIAESEKCNSCAEWLHHCNAECCKLFILTLQKNNWDFSNRVIRIKKNLNKDQALYYQLHHCHYSHGELIVPLYDFEWHEKTKELHVLNRCKGLTEDNQCKYHGTRGQPKVCQFPNINDKGSDKIVVTTHCLYQYK